MYSTLSASMCCQVSLRGAIEAVAKFVPMLAHVADLFQHITSYLDAHSLSRLEQTSASTRASIKSEKLWATALLRDFRASVRNLVSRRMSMDADPKTLYQSR